MIPILFGSQTGNGVFLAKELHKSIKNSFCLPIDSFDLSKINSFPFVIFICSTHGDGQSPFNMVKFYNFILSQNSKIFTFKSAVLGLGDSSYPKYNYCARVLIEKLKILGSEVKIQEFCNSQDLNGMYDGFNRFKNRLTAIDFNNSQDLNEMTDKFNEKLSSQNQEACEQLSSAFKSTPFSYQATVISNKLITPEYYQEKVYEMVLSIPEYSAFLPGDCISILPKNTVNLKNYFDFSDLELDFLRNEIDFFSIVHQLTFQELAKYAKSQAHKDKLLEISQDYDLYHTYILVPRRNLLEVIYDFSLDLPFEFVKSYNKIQPRYFSFSFIDNSIHILYNIVDYSTYLKEKRLGLCTQFMKELKPLDQLSVGVLKSNLYLKDKNLLFFATGTGVTLPRSVIHYFKDKRIVIFYGFRYYNKDQLCKDEFKNVEIYYASSKNDKKYVMDVYKEHPVENIDEWLVFVSGNSRLNKEVKKLLKEVHGKEIKFQSETW